MPGNASFSVGDWKLEPDLDRASRDGERVRLRPQVMGLLVYLAERQPQVIHPDDLMRELWPGKIVSHSCIYNCIAELRRVLDAGGNRPSAIQTIPKKGYRLRAPVVWDVPTLRAEQVYSHLGSAQTTTGGCWRILSR